MLVTCSSCNSKYLVNSADLKPKGKNVQCANCGHNWFQTVTSTEDPSILSSESLNNKNNDHRTENHLSENLPSTYVKEQKASALNSILIVILTIIFVVGFWQLQQKGINFFVLIKYYIAEFYFNLQLIINDLAKIIYQILN